MSQLLRPLIVVALYALLLPVAGPLLDHHYVEWQHNHGHVYLGVGAGDARGYHVHVYDSRGGHGHLPSTDPSDGQQLPDSLSFLVSYDGSGSGLIAAPSGPSAEALRFPDPGNGPLLAAFAAEDVVPGEALILPPRKPPAT
ncbi:MAG: hypothetical protein OXI91_14855 [Chloroflexota bacterium]|nr:hypothetical protein [Chloroflexota bacterium]